MVAKKAYDHNRALQDTAALRGQLGNMQQRLTLSSVVQVDAGTGTNANVAGAHGISAIWNINSTDMNAGTIFEIEAPFQATMQGQNLELGLSIDGSATFTVNDTIGGGIVGAGIIITGIVRVIMQILTTGSSGTFNAFTFGSVGQASVVTSFTNSGSLNGNPAFGGAIDTTIAHNIRINSQWIVSATGQTVSAYGSKFTRSG